LIPLRELFLEDKIMNPKYPLAFFAVALAIAAAHPVYAFGPSEFETYTYEQFRDYWYSGKGEISRFALKQSRYGEIHEGDAVTVFVTEKVNPVLQVKADDPGPEDITVMKLNAVRKFFTGIYPYSVMTSVFSPVDVGKHPLPLKISTSVQEWCGHVWQQMNLRENQYRMESYSYFEKEADREFQIPASLPEEALWNLVRIAPATLPLGEFTVIPDMVYNRFQHKEPKPQQAIGRFKAAEGQSLEGSPLVRYEVSFPGENRTLAIVFETRFPYRIQSWEDTYAPSKITGGEALTTRADRTHILVSAYWEHNRNRDRSMLDKLGLSPRELSSR